MVCCYSDDDDNDDDDDDDDDDPRSVHLAELPGAGVVPLAAPLHVRRQEGAGAGRGHGAARHTARQGE